MAAEERVRSYASALYETAWERWLAALAQVAEVLEQNPPLRERLQAANTDYPQRQRLIDGILPSDMDAPVRNFIYTLAQRDDLDLLPEISGELRERLRRSGARPSLPVEVTSAVPLNEQERQSLAAGLAQYGPDLDVRYHVDPGILGGLVLRIGDKLLDNSLATRLGAMKEALGLARS